MIKKIIISLFYCLFILGITTSCGSQDANTNTNTNTNTGNGSSSTNSDTPAESDIQFTQNVTFFNYTISCPTETSVSDSKYGKTFSYKSLAGVILEAPAAYGTIYIADDYYDAVEKSKKTIIASFESYNIDAFQSGSTIQNVKNTKLVKYNGIDMLKVTGDFYNTVNNASVNYVAYYLLATSPDGINYPVYIVGIPFDGKSDIDSVENFMDTMASKIKYTKK